MPPWLQLMLDSLAPLLWAALVFTIPLTLASFVLGLALGLLLGGEGLRLLTGHGCCSR